VIIWTLNALLIGLLVGYLVAERMAGGFQVVLQFASEPGVAQVGVQVRTSGPSIIHNAHPMGAR